MSLTRQRHRVLSAQERPEILCEQAALTLSWWKSHERISPFVKLPDQSFQLKFNFTSKSCRESWDSPPIWSSVFLSPDGIWCREHRHHCYLFFQDKDSSMQSFFQVKQKFNGELDWVYSNNIYFVTKETMLGIRRSWLWGKGTWTPRMPLGNSFACKMDIISPALPPKRGFSEYQ